MSSRGRSIQHKFPSSRSGASPRNDLLFLHERYRSLIESTNDWLWEVDESMRYTYASPQVSTILGYTPEEVIGKSPFDLMPADEAQRVGEICQPLIKQRRNIKLLVNVNLHKNGNRVYLETSGKPFFDENNRYLGYRGIDRDISERKKLEDDVQNFSNALEQIEEAALILDRDRRIIYLNPTFYSLFGYVPDEILNQHIDRLSPPKSSCQIRADNVIEILNERGKWEGETSRLRKDGRPIPVYLKARTICDEQQNIKGYVGTYFDLTPFKKAEKQMRRALTSTIEAIATTVEKRDPYTFGHQNRVAKLSVSIAEVLNKESEFIKGLEMGAMIHDIGKIYIPAEILNRPGRLSRHELGLIKTHPQVGYDIVKDVDFPWPVAQMILQHHERLDGSGYPNGLKADEIIFEAKILAVADVVEAMTSHRPYRPALDINVSLEELEKNKGVLYDQDVVDACVFLCLKNSFSFD